MSRYIISLEGSHKMEVINVNLRQSKKMHDPTAYYFIPFINLWNYNIRNGSIKIRKIYVLVWNVIRYNSCMHKFAVWNSEMEDRISCDGKLERSSSEIAY